MLTAAQALERPPERAGAAAVRGSW
jgi:hypothetical protein